MLRVEPIPQPPPDLSGVTALAFSSVNGIDAFAALSPERALPVFTVGDATAQAANAAGFEDVASAHGALPDLARLIAEAPNRPGVILVPSAREPSGDLAAFLPGLTVRPFAVYASVETGAAPPDSAVDAVLIHSARAARALAALRPRLDPPVVVAISDQAAEPIRPLSDVFIAAAPTEDALFDALARALGNSPPRV